MNIADLPHNYNQRITQRMDNMRRAFDTRFALSEGSPELVRARELVAQVGTVDAAQEGYSDAAHQRDLSVKFHWGHNHRFNSDLIVPGRMEDRHFQMAAEFLEGFQLQDDHFAQKTVLDIGCWTGGTTLTLKLLGASKITAFEEVRKYAQTAQSLCRDIYGFDDVICKGTSLYELTSEGDQGPYDCIYFPGVIYHLSDPVLALRHLFNQLKDGGDILVESMGIDHDGSMCGFAGNKAEHGSKEEMNRGGWNWFCPSAKCLASWMETAGFEDIQYFRSPFLKNPRVFAYGKRKSYRDITRAGLAIPDVR